MTSRSAATSMTIRPNRADRATAADENQIIAERRAKLRALREKGIAFPNEFRREHIAADLHEKNTTTQRTEGSKSNPVVVKVAGRMMLKRVMGKASFATIQDMSGRIQLYITDSCRARTARGVQALRHRRHPRRRRHAVQDQDRRADGTREESASADQVAAPAAGKVSRPDRSGSNATASAIST